MPPNLRPRYSPSGPFMPDGQNDGFIRRVWDRTNTSDVPADEGGATATVIEVPIVLAATDEPLAELSWIVWADMRVYCAIPQGEEPQHFPVAIVLESAVGGGGPVSTPVVKQQIVWPTSPDDYTLYNDLHARFAFDRSGFPFIIGTNHLRTRMVFYGGGAHTAWCSTGHCRMTVIERQGTPVSYA